MTHPRYQIGDTVTLKAEENTLYIVSAVSSYEIVKDDRLCPVHDYELILILPVTSDVTFSIEEEEDLSLYASYKAKMWSTMIEFIRKDRHKRNLFAEPEFLDIVHSNLHPEPPVKATKKKATYDKVNYESLKTVDECLDALNDLDMLHQLFDDDEFLDQKKKVIKRLKKLTS